MLNDFISNAKTIGLARTNRYRVTITPPNSMITHMNSGRLITLFCESVNLPGHSLVTVEQKIIGETREFYYKKIYNSNRMTFYIDNNFEVKSFFNTWVDRIISTQGKTTSYYEEYIAPTITIDVLPLHSEIASYSTTLYEAYPNFVSDIKYAANSRDVAKVNVNFVYKYYTTSSMIDRSNSTAQ